MSEITIENASKVYSEEVIAVDDVSLTITDGELVVLVGPSGSGKSTTLRMIAGLESLTSGDISIGGERVNRVPPQNRDIAMVFQSFALYPHRTVRKNLSFPLEARSFSNDEIDRKVEETAETLDIGELLDRNPAQLSGGQQQRVALGRAIIRDPQAFLMDEPLANLDAKLRKEMRREVVLLQQRLGVTMIHVTHNQEEAMTMGDRIAVMNDGKIQQFAPPDETYRQPANRFVAEFIGGPSMNTIEGYVENSQFVADDVDFAVSLPESLQAPITDDNRITLGIRPEHVVFADNDLTLKASVKVIENLGNVQVAYFDLGPFEFLAEVGPDEGVAVDDTIGIYLPPEHLHLFNGIGPGAKRIERHEIETTV